MTKERLLELTALCDRKDRFLIGEGGMEMQILNGFICDAGFADRAVATGAALGVRIEERPSMLTTALAEALDDIRVLRENKVSIDHARSYLWSQVAIAASHHWVMPVQPITVADAVLAAWDERFGGKQPGEKATEPVAPVKPLDPVDAILEKFK